MMSNINKETTHDLVVEMWNNIAENIVPIKKFHLIELKKKFFLELVKKFNVKVDEDYDLHCCFSCIFYNKNFEEDCEKCPFSKYEKIMPTESESKRNTYCEDSVKSPYRKIWILDSFDLKSIYSCNSILPIKNREFSEWQMRCFKKHCIEICDLFIE